MGHCRKKLSVMAFSLAILAICPSCSMLIGDSGKTVGLPPTRALAVEKWGDPIVTKLVKRGDPLIAELMKKRSPYGSTLESTYKYDLFLYRGKLRSRETAITGALTGYLTLGVSEVIMTPYAAAEAGASLIKKHYFFSGYNAKGKPVYFEELKRDESAIVESGKLGKID